MENKNLILYRFKEGVHKLFGQSPDGWREIVNPEMLINLCLSLVSGSYWYFGNHETPLRLLKSEDTFHLPDGLELRKEFLIKNGSGAWEEFVFRLVKSEVKEEDLWGEVEKYYIQQSIIRRGVKEIFNDIKSKFIIKRI